jgi:hypothetical protein
MSRVSDRVSGLGVHRDSRCDFRVLLGKPASLEDRPDGHNDTKHGHPHGIRYQQNKHHLDHIALAPEIATYCIVNPCAIFDDQINWAPTARQTRRHGGANVVSIRIWRALLQATSGRCSGVLTSRAHRIGGGRARRFDDPPTRLAHEAITTRVPARSSVIISPVSTRKHRGVNTRRLGVIEVECGAI